MTLPPMFVMRVAFRKVNANNTYFLEIVTVPSDFFGLGFKLLHQITETEPLAGFRFHPTLLLPLPNEEENPKSRPYIAQILSDQLIMKPFHKLGITPLISNLQLERDGCIDGRCVDS
jgi:hypothetical protein